MNIHATPHTHQKLLLLNEATRFEPAGDSPETETRVGRYQSRSLSECVTHLSTPKGKKAVLKTMVTTACEKDCLYCPFRAGRGKTRRLTFKPDELAGAFDTMQRSGQADGLFLSSGIIKGSITTQDKIIDTVEIVRKRYSYRGYVHLKIMPGSEYDQIVRAMQLADRVSLNLEAPTQERLNALAPKKDFTGELLQRLQWMHEIRQRFNLRTSVVTQFVVGAVGDTDLELLALTSKLYNQMHLARAYYSAFNPVSQTPLEDVASVEAIREHRLYQASFLLRDYGWDVEDMSFLHNGNLRTDVDPKRAWAEVHLAHKPVDVMRGSREELMRVPGIGAVTADAIVKARRTARLTDISQLKMLGIRAPEQTIPYILLDGRIPQHQLKLF